MERLVELALPCDATTDRRSTPTPTSLDDEREWWWWAFQSVQKSDGSRMEVCEPLDVSAVCFKAAPSMSSPIFLQVIYPAGITLRQSPHTEAKRIKDRLLRPVIFTSIKEEEEEGKEEEEEEESHQDEIDFSSLSSLPLVHGYVTFPPFTILTSLLLLTIRDEMYARIDLEDLAEEEEAQRQTHAWLLVSKGGDSFVDVLGLREPVLKEFHENPLEVRIPPKAQSVLENENEENEENDEKGFPILAGPHPIALTSPLSYLPFQKENGRGGKVMVDALFFFQRGELVFGRTDVRNLGKVWLLMDARSIEEGVPSLSTVFS